MDNVIRKLRKASFLIAIGVCAATATFAQSTRKLMKDGNKFFDDENYRAALPFYEQVLAKEPNDETALFRAGVSYMAFDKEKASDYLYKAQKIKPKVSKDVEYWLGRADHINYRFDDAIGHYKAYDASLKSKDQRKPEVAMLIQQSKNAKDLFNKPKDIYLKNLGPAINTQYSEHSPVISSDDNYLLFTSRGEGVTGGKKAADGDYFEDVFESKRVGADEWEQPRSLSSALNGKGHDATIQIYDNDTKLLLYRDEDKNGDIYYSEKKDGNWSSPNKL